MSDRAPEEASDGESTRPAFAHASEEELARILDFYEVRWEYEPHVFPILWNLDGAVLESFAPDFYLPDLDLYVELTTLKQSLVRKKNRKLRRLRELYPEIRIKLFYGRDFRALMLKYGKVGLIDELSGTSGQAGLNGREEEGIPLATRAETRTLGAAASRKPVAAGAKHPKHRAADREPRRSAVAHPASLGTRTARSRRAGSSASPRIVKER